MLKSASSAGKYVFAQCPRTVFSKFLNNCEQEAESEAPARCDTGSLSGTLQPSTPDSPRLGWDIFFYEWLTSWLLFHVCGSSEIPHWYKKNCLHPFLKPVLTLGVQKMFSASLLQRLCLHNGVKNILDSVWDHWLPGDFGNTRWTEWSPFMSVWVSSLIL